MLVTSGHQDALGGDVTIPVQSPVSKMQPFSIKMLHFLMILNVGHVVLFLVRVQIYLSV